MAGRSNTAGYEALAVIGTDNKVLHAPNPAWVSHSVAEGVEQPSHLNLLWQMGCDIAQGYLLSRPVPGDDLLAWAKGDGLVAIRTKEFSWSRS